MSRFLKNFLGVAAGLFFGLVSAYAIKGGPWDNTSVNVVGVYAGVLTPNPSATPNATAPPCNSNAIGVFSVNSPQSGLATGAFVMFAQGRVFNGKVNAVADPKQATLKGVLSSTYNFTVYFSTPCPSPVGSCTPTTQSQQITATANGNINARIGRPQTTVTSAGAIRLKGSAELDISNGTVSSFDLSQNVDCALTLTVTGFKQSNTPSIATATGTP